MRDRILAVGLGVAIVLLGVQTYRLHQLTQVARAAGILETTNAGKLANVRQGGDADADFPDGGSGTDSHGSSGKKSSVSDDALAEQDLEMLDALDQLDGQDGNTADGDKDAKAGKRQDKDSASGKTEDELTGRKARKDLDRRIQALTTGAKEAIRKGDYESAVDLYKQCIEADPTRREGYQDLAKLYRKMGMSDEELATYASWSENRPQDATPHYMQAQLYESMGMDQEALEQLQQFQQLTNGKLDSYSMAASLYRKLDMPDQEFAALQQWVNGAPASADAQRAMAQFYNRSGDRASAIPYYEAAAQLMPQNAQVQRELASAYQRLGRYDDAQAALVNAMNIQPQNMDIRMQLAQVYNQIGDRGAAIQTYSDIIADAPGSHEAFQAQRAIDRIERQIAAGQQPSTPPRPRRPKNGQT